MKARWRSVIFLDLDDTIMQGPFRSVVFPTVFRELAHKSGLAVDEIRRLVFRENLERQKNPSVSATVAMDWDDIVETISDRLEVTLEANVQDLANSHASSPYAVLLDKAPEVLQRLNRNDRAIVAVTMGLRKYQVPILNALNIAPLFVDILTPDSNNALKQEEAFYGRWPQLSELQIAVGDHYEDDVLAPKEFGFKAVWKPNTELANIEAMSPFSRPMRFPYRKDQTVVPDAIILSLQELPEVVTHLEEAFTKDHTP